MLLTFVISLLISLSFGQKYVSDDELKQFSETALNKDVNNVGAFVNLHLQGKSKANSTEDNAPLPLLTVDHRGLAGPTISKLPSLYNNFIPDTNLEEQVNNDEITEQTSFIDAVLNSAVMLHTKQFLASKELVPSDTKAFKNFLYNLWFKLYSRGKKKLSSSAFEHIFLGEIKNNQISGFHNWLYYYYLESLKKQLNYLGWLRKVDFPDKKGSMVKLHFTWGNFTKPVGSMFVGTSPELEMSLYTVCFLARPNNKCHLTFGGKKIIIQTYTFTHGNEKILSSAYPLM